MFTDIIICVIILLLLLVVVISKKMINLYNHNSITLDNFLLATEPLLKDGMTLKNVSEEPEGPMYTYIDSNGNFTYILSLVDLEQVLFYHHKKLVVYKFINFNYDKKSIKSLIFKRCEEIGNRED